MAGDDKDAILNINPESDVYTRRRFLQVLMAGSGILALGMAGCDLDPVYSRIIVDYDKCAGCRTCEAVCSAFHTMNIIDGVEVEGTGNPNLARIRVLHYNPDVTIPVVCAMCPDTPCIRTCTSIPDAVTGLKALYRDEVTGAIRHNPKQCEQCGTCAATCAAEGVGIITSNRETTMPEHLCTLCGGEPRCVEYCPQKALSYTEVDETEEFYRMQPDELALELARRWYG